MPPWLVPPHRRVMAQLVIFLGTGVLLASPAVAVPTNPLCESDDSYRRAHPLICDTEETGPFDVGGGGSSSSNGGGLLDVIGDIIGGVLGGGGGLPGPL